MSDTVSVSERVIELAKEMVESEPALQHERPPTEQIQQVHIIDEEETHGKPYVEVFMEIHKNGQACEPLTAEFFPHGRPEDLDSPPRIQRAPADEPCVRLLQPEVLSDEEHRQYRVFGAVVGRLAYHEP